MPPAHGVLASRSPLTVMRSQGAAKRLIDRLGALDIGSAFECPARVTLFRQDDPVSSVYLVEDGVVKLTTALAGEREAFIGLRTAGGLLGISPALLSIPHVTTARTGTACRLRQIPLGMLVTGMRHDLDIANWVSRSQAQDDCHQTPFVASFGVLHVGERLRRFLGTLLQTQAIALPDGSVRIQPLLTHEEIAQAICSTRESVSRLLRDFEARGLLRRTKGWYVIPSDSPILHGSICDEYRVGV